MRYSNRRRSLLEEIARIPRWMWFFIGMGGLALALVPAISLARYTTSSSDYCLTCHGTGDTPDRGRPSLVHPSFQKVSCVACHARPHQVVYEGYVKGFMAEAERVTPNCQRCHSGMASTKEQKDFKYNFLNITITHQAHTQRGATCVTCHTNVAHDLAPVPTNRPRMEACYTCHARTDNCLKCHSKDIPEMPLPPPAPPSPDMLGDGRVYYLRICSACHGPKGDRVPGVDLHSRGYLQKRGTEALLRSVANGRGDMHGFSLGKGGALNREQILSILAYLEEESVTKVSPSPEVLYNRYCLVCHGADGNKVAGVALGTPAYWAGADINLAFTSVQGGKSGMPPFGKGEGGTLTRQEMMSILELLSRRAGVPMEQ